MSKLRGFSSQEISSKEGMTDNITSNTDFNFLDFNLSAFGLQAYQPLEEKEPNQCCIEIFIRQLYSKLDFENDCGLVRHLKSIGLTGIVKNDISLFR